jgi:hypothetical protein
VVEQVADAPAEQAESTPGGSTCFSVEELDHPPSGESAVLVAGLLSTGHAGEQRGGGLLGEAPGREVEGVDVHGHAAPGQAHVLAEAARPPRTSSDGAVEQEVAIAELLPRSA